MTIFDRRHFVTGLAAAAATAGTLAAAAGGGAATRIAAAPAAGGDPLEDPAQLHRLYRRIRFAGDERVFFWWMEGRRYGLVDNLLVPFFDMRVGSMHRCRDLGEGRYEVATASAIYFTDLDSGELLEDWANPVTGRTVRFTYPAPARSVSVYSESTGVLSEPTPPGMRMERRHVVMPLQVRGPDAWLTEESHLRVFRGADGRSQKVADMYTFMSPVAALRDPGLAFVPTIEQFNDYNDWSPRFEMGDSPGSGVARCSGRKVATLDELPSAYLRLARRLHPDAFREPARTLG
jgi:hypothetical protein